MWALSWLSENVHLVRNSTASSPSKLSMTEPRRSSRFICLEIVRRVVKSKRSLLRLVLKLSRTLATEGFLRDAVLGLGLNL